MSMITASLSDTLLSTVPMLNASGSNWAIFVFRFQDAVEAKGFWDHFDGLASRPMAANATPMVAETVAMAQWDKDERSARSLLMQKLPDSTVVLIHEKKTMRERMGGGCKGVLEEERICAGGLACQVHGHAVSGEGESEGVP